MLALRHSRIWGEHVMKRVVFGLAVLAAGILSASTTQASQFAFNFCPGNASCPADLTEASITFTTKDGTADVNDYSVAITFKGTLTNTFIDMIDFTADIDMAKPTLDTPPAGPSVSTWNIFFDKVDNGNGCSTDGNNKKFACAVSATGNGPDFAGTNTWIFSVDFDGNSLVSANSAVNLRALFVDANGGKVGSILSPDGKAVTTTTTVTPTTDGTPTTSGTVPEPALLSMLGLGLAGAAYRSRRRG